MENKRDFEVKNGGIPPAVGEFAVEERQQLLERIAEQQALAIELARLLKESCDEIRALKAQQPNFCPGSNPENPQEDDGQTYMGEPVIHSDVLVERTAMQRLFKACGCSGSVNNTQLVDLAANKLEARAALTASAPTSHRVLLLCSYCGDDDADCTDESPCIECLKMCNVAMVNGAMDVLGGLEYLKASAPNHSEQVPDGWQLVPRQPTDAMVQAVLDSGMYHTPATAWPILVDEYKAMLAAAPSAGNQQGEGE